MLVEHTFNLNQLHKLYQKLCAFVASDRPARKSSYRFDADDTEAYIKLPVHKLTNPDAIQELIKKEQLRADVRNVIELDRITVKQLLFQANSTSGVSERLALLDFHKKQLVELTSLGRSLDEFPSLPVLEAGFTNEDCVNIQTAANEQKITYVYVQLYTLDELQKRQYESLGTINKLETEIETLNATTQVKINLSDSSEYALGLK